MCDQINIFHKKMLFSYPTFPQFFRERFTIKRNETSARGCDTRVLNVPNFTEYLKIPNI